ncbi:MAG TPA: sialate O-acetylesterase, partial [Opitutaceae bacterium]
MSLLRSLLLAAAGGAALEASAQATPPAPDAAALFQDHAVLQSDKPVPIWGRAAPGEHVSVGFAGQRVGTTAGPDGRWIVVLTPLAANATGADLTITGKATVTLHDVLVGEVWLCSGQSNMEFAVDGGGPLNRVDNAAAEVADARFPLIRQFKVAPLASIRPLADTSGAWKACSPETVGAFTAVGYFFARDLFQRLGVPIGIVNCTWSGSPIESWMSPVALAAFPGYSNGHAAGALPGPVDPWIPSSLFNGMIHPLLPYAIRGALWYQGESNVGRAAAYGAQFPAMIKAWRSHFGEGDFPFFWVQLANFAPPREAAGDRLAFLREAQSRALALPGTGQAVAIDIGEPGNIHPRNKQEVGRRLALIAKANVYSIPVDFSGPVFSQSETEGGSVRVRFQFAG